MERFNLHQTERFWLRKLMFTFQPSLFQTPLFSFIVEKTSQRRCEIAKPKHCQTNPVDSYGSLQTCQKKRKLPPEVSCFCVQMRMSLKYFFHTHYTVRQGIGRLELWALASCDYFMAQWDGALRHKTRKGR